jgi:hypothetical protein
VKQINNLRRINMILVCHLLVTRVLPTFRTWKTEGALMSYQSFLEKGSTVFFPFPFLPFDRRLFFLRRYGIQSRPSLEFGKYNSKNSLMATRSEIRSISGHTRFFQSALDAISLRKRTVCFVPDSHFLFSGELHESGRRRRTGRARTDNLAVDECQTLHEQIKPDHVYNLNIR